MPKRKAVRGLQPPLKKQKENKNEEEGSVKASIKTGISSDTDWKELDTSQYSKKIDEHLQVQMPQDFFIFWEFCKSVNTNNPKDALRRVSDLQLCGPYDLLLPSFKALPSDQNNNYYLHSRHYYDPPEFTTVLESIDFDGSEGFHIGYWRDDPSLLPDLMVTNRSAKNGQFAVYGDNIFSAVYNHLESIEKLTRNKEKSNHIKELMKTIKLTAGDLNYSLDILTPGIKKRKKDRVVTTSFHKVGICVPVDENEIGYRPLTVSDDYLRKLLEKIGKASSNDDRENYFDQLYEIVTLIQFANDECDYGMGLEFGIDLFIHGLDVLHKTILNVLPLAYELLNRGSYANIVRAHLENRCKKPVNYL